MSIHGVKSKRRHPTAPREHFEVGHITFELSEENKTFALVAGQATNAKDRRPLFSGTIEKGMGTALRRLAHKIDDIEGSA